jgi:glyoxylase-like metal-dependent hydrolase (beta-lactamase superfamily II)
MGTLPPRNTGKGQKLYDFAKGSVKFIRGGRYPHCNSVLVDDQVRAVIDAASDESKLLSFKEKGRVDYLITSHAHEDHLVYNYLFPESTFCSHSLDAPHFEDVKSLADCYGDMPPEAFQKWCDFFVKECHYVPRRVDQFLENGMVMDFGETSMEVLHTPGHTEGHCVFYFPQEKILFTADLDLTRSGPYYADRTSDIEKTIRSLERMKRVKAETYLTAHGKGIYQGDPAYIDRYLKIIFYREDRLFDFLRQGPKTLEQITAEGIIYGKNPAFMGAWDLTISERMMIAKHLDWLIRRGDVRKDGALYVLNE